MKCSGLRLHSISHTRVGRVCRNKHELMFAVTNAFDQSLDSWNVSSVTNMEMFTVATAFNGNIENWDVECIRMRLMFYDG